MQRFLSPLLELPWNASEEDDHRYWRYLVVALAILFVISIATPFVPVPEQTREEKEKLPPNLARVILEKEEIIPPPPVPTPEPTPEPETEEEPEPEPTPAPENEPTPEPTAVPTPKPDVQKARDTAKVSGLLQFQDALADMREAVDMKDVQSNDITAGASEAESTDRSMITSGATVGSGGIRTAELSTNTGGVALSGRETTTIETPVGITGTGNEEAQSGRRGATGACSTEGVRKGIERHKSAIFSIYQRALRQNPALQGKMVLSIVISPDGRVTNVSTLVSDLNDNALETKILNRVRLITFPACGDVGESTVEYTFNFLP